jgi:hypothetical protein
MVETVRRQAGRKRRVLVKASASVLAAEESRAASHRSFWGGVRGGPFCKKGLPGHCSKSSQILQLSLLVRLIFTHPFSDCLLEASVSGMVEALASYGLR